MLPTGQLHWGPHTKGWAFDVGKRQSKQSERALLLCGGAMDAAFALPPPGIACLQDK